MPTILIGGDVVPMGRPQAAFERGDAGEIFHDLLPEFRAADLAVVNLECPLVERATPTDEPGCLLGAPARCVRGLQAAGVRAVGLANNHVLDHGVEGLRSTLAACRGAGLLPFGAGLDHDEASCPVVVPVGRWRVALVGLAEEGFWSATPKSPGANRLDVGHFIRSLRKLRGESDLLIVLLHAGVEHAPFPSPALRATARILVEEGAGAVICQHSHCPAGYEVYGHAPIVYGQGNLVFDEPRNPELLWTWGYLVRLNIDAPGACAVSVVPYVQNADQPGTRRMNAEEDARFQQALAGWCDGLQDERWLHEQWLRVCRNREDYYLSVLHGQGCLGQALNRRIPWLRWWYGASRRRRLLGIVRSESAREILQSLCS
jgi:hypothetical protein